MLAAASAKKKGDFFEKYMKNFIQIYSKMDFIVIFLINTKPRSFPQFTAESENGIIRIRPLFIALGNS